MKSIKSATLQTGLLFLALAVLAACRGPLLPPTAGETAAAPPAASATARPVAASPTLPAAGEPSLTPTAGPVTPVVHGVLTTPTPTYPPRPTMPTATPTAAASPTPAQPWAVVAVQAHCRYGPGVAYLHAADLYPGDRGVIDGRNPSGTWLWILLDGLERHCWAATSTLTVNGAIDSVNVVESRLPYSDLYGPPQNVQTARDGSEVTIAWDPIPFTVDDDRGYMLELRLCQNGALSTQAFQTYDSILTVTDELDCNGFSGGTLWGVEKHGYTQPVEIPWP